MSHQTVSRVLNDHPSVRPATRERVLAAISTLGYRRNLAARALVTRRSGTLGLLAPRSTLYGPTATLIGLEQAARARGWFVSLASVAHFDEAALARAVDHFVEQHVEGVVVSAPLTDAVPLIERLAPEVPTVVVSTDLPPGPGYGVVGIDQAAGARLATRHLLDLGHREVVHLAGPPDWLDAVARRRGWEAELAAAGVAAGEVPVGDWSADSGYAIGRRLAERPPTAIFAANDMMALGLVRALTESGLRVPTDVSVVGFDDVEPVAYALPPLTTVRQDFEAVARAGMALLLDWLDGRPPTGPALLAPSLVVRESTAPPRS